MNPFEMVVLIVAITAIAGIFRAKYRHRRYEDEDGGEPVDGADGRRMQEELRALRERVIVLERIVTDNNNRAAQLDHEIEALRHHPRD